MKRIVILGSTGSIGRQALEVIAAFPDRLAVAGLACGRDVACLAGQIERWRPARAAVADPAAADRLRGELAGRGPEVLAGAAGLARLAAETEADLVLSAIVGAAGLEPAAAALAAGRTVALANKETLVTAGPAVTAIARRRGSRILPVDSEHSALAQCLQGRAIGEVRRVVLTASGGPFAARPELDFARVTPEEALRHPRWKMGPKVTVDSATLMNKGLELIEARWLFDLPVARMDVLIHPQSAVHTLVEFRDGSLVAQLAPPDMRLPILAALAWPERWESPWPRLELAGAGPLSFAAPDLGRFPCLRLARAAGESGGTAPAVLNAANEVAVAAFLERRIAFDRIPAVVEETLGRLPVEHGEELALFLAADEQARRTARALCGTAP